MKVLKTLLGSCVGLVGYLDWFGFMVHINFYKDTQEILDQLRYDIKKEVGCILEDFHLTLSWWNNTIQSSWKIGIKNIESVLKNINREPDKLLHVWKNKGNRIQLDLISGQVTSKS